MTSWPSTSKLTCSDVVGVNVAGNAPPSRMSSACSTVRPKPAMRMPAVPSGAALPMSISAADKVSCPPSAAGSVHPVDAKGDSASSEMCAADSCALPSPPPLPSLGVASDRLRPAFTCTPSASEMPLDAFSDTASKPPCEMDPASTRDVDCVFTSGTSTCVVSAALV
ncbi:hypothetical protein D9M72_479330 [compost metagenome]